MSINVIRLKRYCNTGTSSILLPLHFLHFSTVPLFQLIVACPPKNGTLTWKLTTIPPTYKRMPSPRFRSACRRRPSWSHLFAVFGRRLKSPGKGFDYIYIWFVWCFWLVLIDGASIFSCWNIVQYEMVAAWVPEQGLGSKYGLDYPFYVGKWLELCIPGLCSLQL